MAFEGKCAQRVCDRLSFPVGRGLWICLFHCSFVLHSQPRILSFFSTLAFSLSLLTANLVFPSFPRLIYCSPSLLYSYQLSTFITLTLDHCIHYIRSFTCIHYHPLLFHSLVLQTKRPQVEKLNRCLEKTWKPKKSTK